MIDLLQEIDKVILSEKKDVRDYIGASSIGGECPRKLWYRFNNYPEHFDALSLRRFADGHAVEARVVGWLQQIKGIELWTHDENGKQYGFSDLDGKFKGHYDGVIKMNGETFVFDVKATSEKQKVDRLKERFPEHLVLQQWNDEYYAQAMCYCYYAGIDNHLIICTDAGGRNITTIRTPANHSFAKALMQKAKRIADAKEPPEKVGGKNYWKCKKMCAFYSECWDGA